MHESEEEWAAGDEPGGVQDDDLPDGADDAERGEQRLAPVLGGRVDGQQEGEHRHRQPVDPLLPHDDGVGLQVAHVDGRLGRLLVRPPLHHLVVEVREPEAPPRIVRVQSGALDRMVESVLLNPVVHAALKF